ncbi:hypothetical protein NCC49_004886 [Naganishia albida]|nr:hypothetical protein NCC49_004886 [Naganishia albida]
MNDLEAAKRTEPSLVIIPLDATFDLFRIPSAESGRLIGQLEALSSKALRYSIDHPMTPPSKENIAATTAYEKASGNRYVSITRTQDEISLLVDKKVGDELRANDEWMRESEAGLVEHEGPYGCLRVRGPMPLYLTGIAANFTKTLQNASIAVFVISTWDTDWIFVKQDKVSEAAAALANDGWVVI